MNVFMHYENDCCEVIIIYYATLRTINERSKEYRNRCEFIL